MLHSTRIRLCIIQLLSQVLDRSDSEGLYLGCRLTAMKLNAEWINVRAISVPSINESLIEVFASTLAATVCTTLRQAKSLSFLDPFLSVMWLFVGKDSENPLKENPLIRSRTCETLCSILQATRNCRSGRSRQANWALVRDKMPKSRTKVRGNTGKQD